MPRATQGNIFDRAESDGLLLVFGHIGFNLMQPYWREFRQTSPLLQHVHDPFRKFSEGPFEWEPDRWIWFVEDRENERGLSDRSLLSILKRAEQWAASHGKSLIVSNGVRDVGHGMNSEENRTRNANRARLLLDFAEQSEKRTGIQWEFRVLSNVFLRP